MRRPLSSSPRGDSTPKSRWPHRQKWRGTGRGALAKTPKPTERLSGGPRPPTLGVVAGILGHLLAFERDKSLHSSARGITLADVPERRRQTGEDFMLCPGNPSDAVDRVSKIAFQICPKSECVKTSLRHERVKFERFSGVALA